jgi:hypothetical protein
MISTGLPFGDAQEQAAYALVLEAGKHLVQALMAELVQEPLAAIDRTQTTTNTKRSENSTWHLATSRVAWSCVHVGSGEALEPVEAKARVLHDHRSLHLKLKTIKY